MLTAKRAVSSGKPSETWSFTDTEHRERDVAADPEPDLLSARARSQLRLILAHADSDSLADVLKSEIEWLSMRPPSWVLCWLGYEGGQRPSRTSEPYSHAAYSAR